MSGWLDWFEDKIKCPFCGAEIIVLFCEDGALRRDPIVITTLAGNIKCSVCNKDLSDEGMDDLLLI